LAPLLINNRSRSSLQIAFLGLAAFASKVPHLPTVEARKVASGRLLQWPDCSLLQRWSRSTVELLLLLLLLQLELPLLVLRVIAQILQLLRSAQLSRRWGIHHVVLGRSTTKPTTSRGSRHHPLPFLLFGLSNGLHRPLLINGSTRQVIIEQVGRLYQAILQLMVSPLQ
jgi:hypothetical protein